MQPPKRFNFQIQHHLMQLTLEAVFIINKIFSFLKGHCTFCHSVVFWSESITILTLRWKQRMLSSAECDILCG